MRSSGADTDEVGEVEMLKTALNLGPEDAGMRLSADQFANADFQEPYVYERARGRLAVMSPSGTERFFRSPRLCVS